MPPTPDRIIRIKTVLSRTGLSRSTLYRKIGEGTFPHQVQISINGAGWYESDRSGSVCLHSDRRRISGLSAGCFLDLPILRVLQGGRSPSAVTRNIGGQVHAAIFTGRLSKYV